MEGSGHLRVHVMLGMNTQMPATLQRQFFLDGRLTLLPEPLRRRGMQAVAARE